MNFRPFLLSLAIPVAFSGCSTEEQSVSETDSLPPVPVLSIPGTIQIPAETGMLQFDESDHTEVLLYCWIPMGQYAESEADLIFLGTLIDRGITAVPVQFSQEVRNAAQNQLNQLGIPVAVAMGDDSLRQYMDLEVLPAAIYIRSTGEASVQTGFGCAERAVRSLN